MRLTWVALTDVAFPGFFRPGTGRMGSYYGVRCEGELIAMGGERLRLEGYPRSAESVLIRIIGAEDWRAQIIWQLVEDHRRDGLVSWLHVVESNHVAIRLYLRMGFVVEHRVTLSKLVRTD
jgi:hypothetical protein